MIASINENTKLSIGVLILKIKIIIVVHNITLYLIFFGPKTIDQVSRSCYCGLKIAKYRKRKHAKLVEISNRKAIMYR